MPRKRRSYPAELKAKVALEALREEATMAGFSGNHDRHEASREAEIKELRAKIGELVIDRDFLSKAFGR